MNYKDICKKLIENGVNIIDINNTYIDKEVVIKKGTIIYPNTAIRGNTIIGENNTIDMGSIIINSNIGTNNVIINSYIENSTIGNNNSIGPYARLRGNAIIKDNVVIGNFVEIKNSTLNENVKAKHLSYLGDATIGNNVNIGGGTITANLNGKDKVKNKTVICDNSYIGANTVLVAPLVLNKNCLIGAGSVITRDVEEDALAIARERQVNKLNFNKKEGNV